MRRKSKYAKNEHLGRSFGRLNDGRSIRRFDEVLLYSVFTVRQNALRFRSTRAWMFENDVFVATSTVVSVRRRCRWTQFRTNEPKKYFVRRFKSRLYYTRILFVTLRAVLFAQTNVHVIYAIYLNISPTRK